MKELSFMPVRPGTISESDKISLREAGVIVIEHEDPASIRIIRPGADIEAGEMLCAAMKALKSQKGTTADKQREIFSLAVADIIIGKNEQ